MEELIVIAIADVAAIPKIVMLKGLTKYERFPN
jgi:hypothetical protein